MYDLELMELCTAVTVRIVTVWNSRHYAVISQLLLEELTKSYPELVTKKRSDFSWSAMKGAATHYIMAAWLGCNTFQSG